jgi:hypothetical protein
MRKYYYFIMWGVVAYLQGCAVGYNSTLFVTQSNIGLNAETKPPVLEMSIARREGVIAPGFEGGQTPPVMASFRTESNPFSRFFFGVKSTFAGGDAAVFLSQSLKDNSAVCLSKKPDAKKILWVFDVSVPEKGAVEPFFFGTDTTFGLKVTWGTNGEIPDSVRLGFSRTEFAWAPVFGTDVRKCKIPGTEQDGTYAVWMPPFLAVLDNDVQTGTPTQTKVSWLQYFATGESATALAKQDGVRAVMMERMDPVTYQTGAVDSSDPTVPCIGLWLRDNPEHQKELQTWWKSKGLTGFPTLAVKTPEYKEQRSEFTKEKKICN